MSDEKKPWRVRVIILVVLILAAVGWMTLFDQVWPQSANAVLCEDTQCDHPKATKKIHRKYKRGDMRRSGENNIEFVVNKSARKKILKAYSSFTSKVAYADAAPALKAQFEADALAAQKAVPMDWPSPGDWWRTFKDRAKCTLSGVTTKTDHLVCSVKQAKSNTVFHAMAEKTRMVVNEATRVSVKCGGAAVLGGLTQDGKAAVKKAFGIGVRGGWGMAAFGAGCLWAEYFNRWSPW